MDYANLGNTPISEDQPAGVDCRYDEAFENLQVEIDKLSSPTAAAGKVDWSEIVETSAGILSKQSKDLTVASYLAVALVHTHRIKGLDQGLMVLKDLLGNYWDDLYPPKKRMRGRMGAVTWWSEKTMEVLEQTRAKPIPADMAERMQGNLKALDQLLVERLPEPPSLALLQRQIKAIPLEKKPAATKTSRTPDADEPAPGKNNSTGPAPAVQTVPVAEAPSSIESDQDAQKSIANALQGMRQPSFYLLQQDLSNPLAYRYRRIATWAALNTIPPNSDGATQIQAPPPQVLTDLTALREEGNWPGLIQSCEQKISQYIFWFDLHCMVAEGLKKLGADHRKALDEVCRETAFFLLRLPGVEQLAFADGMSFADPQTRTWLKTIGFGEGSGGSTDRAAAESGPDELLGTQLQKALAMARKKRLSEALGLLQKEMLQASSRQQKMRWRLAIIQVLLAVKKSQLAIPHIEQVLADIDAFNLEAWDPAMALQGLTAAWKGFNAQSVNEYKVRGLEIFNRIARLFPAEALRISQ